MNTIPFIKMAGAGNDFIVVENHSYAKSLKKLAQEICNRTQGIGADGLLILDKSKGCDYRMRIINSDGSEAEMCGNGARCMAAYIVKKFHLEVEMFSIETLAGTIFCKAKKEYAAIKLSDPCNYKEDIQVDMNKKTLKVNFIDTGVPHAVIYVDNLSGIDVNGLGKTVRYHRKFMPKGTNVNFVEELGANHIGVRTYERGVESETKACGTGSAAAAVVTYLKTNRVLKDKNGIIIKVDTAGGETLKIKFDVKDSAVKNLWLNGSAKFIAQGKYFL